VIVVTATAPNPREAETSESWNEKKRILVVLAHPDDPEFFCGASIARWTAAGHEVHYCLLTRGERGMSDKPVGLDEVKRIREGEERAAAGVLGVSSVCFLDFPDGYLMPSIEARGEIVRVIRQVQPDVVVTSDPTNYFPRVNYINHPDHRLAGEIALGAVFPAAGNRQFFPEQIESEGLPLASVKEIWITLTHQPSVALDVTSFWEKRIEALLQHKSQIPDPAALRERQLTRRTPDSTPENPRFEDGFRRVMLT
jgi:LmbE family N-acetylglucosaminyl deacetylase